MGLEVGDGIVLGAAIAGCVTILTAILTFVINRRAQETQIATQAAKFRQAWINSLRVSLAEFEASLLSNKVDENIRNNINKFSSQIYLHLDPHDKNYTELINAMGDLVELRRKGLLLRGVQSHGHFKEISQKILKAEWVRLKDDLRKRQI